MRFVTNRKAFVCLFLLCLLFLLGLNVRASSDSVSDRLDWPKAQFDLKNTNSRSIGSWDPDRFEVSWTYNWGVTQSGPLTLSDLNDNQDIEVLLVNDRNGAFVPVELGFGPLFTFQQKASRSYTSATVSDINSDDKLEIYYGLENGDIISLHEDGSFRWKYTVAGRATTQPVIADFDRDGQKEILVNYYSLRSNRLIENSISSTLVMLTQDGEQLWEHKFGNGSTDYAPAVHDLDDDGYLDIVGMRLDVSGDQPMTHVYRLDGPYDSLKANSIIADNMVFEQTFIGKPVRSPILSQGGNTYHIAFGTSNLLQTGFNSKIRLLTPNGDLLSEKALEDSIYGGWASLDVDFDGKEEYIVGTLAGMSIIDYHEGTLVVKKSVDLGPVRHLSAAYTEDDFFIAAGVHDLSFTDPGALVIYSNASIQSFAVDDGVALTAISEQGSVVSLSYRGTLFEVSSNINATSENHDGADKATPSIAIPIQIIALLVLVCVSTRRD